MRNRQGIGFFIFCLALLLLAIAFVVFFLAKSCYVDAYTIEGTVKSKFLSPADGGTTFVVILIDNNRKLEVKRNWWYSGGEFNEDVIYNQIEVGKKYRFTCWGWQLDWWSIYWYPNIIKAEQIP